MAPSHEGKAPPEELATKLLDRLPGDERVWTRLAKQHDVQLRFGLFLDRWNRGLDFSPKFLARIACLHAVVIFDIYGPDGLVDVVESPPRSALRTAPRTRKRPPG